MGSIIGSFLKFGPYDLNDPINGKMNVHFASVIYGIMHGNLYFLCWMAIFLYRNIWNYIAIKFYKAI